MMDFLAKIINFSAKNNQLQSILMAMKSISWSELNICNGQWIIMDQGGSRVFSRGGGGGSFSLGRRQSFGKKNRPKRRF